MKRGSIIIIFTALVCFIGQAQSTRQFIALSVGPSFPTGDFAKTDLNDSTSGWAKTGVTVGISYAYRFTHNLGIYAIGMFGSNRFDNEKYRDALMTENPDYGVSVESTSNWSSGGILVGPFLRFPLGEKFSWDVRAAFGFYGGSSPNITIRATNNTDQSKEEYRRQGGRGFSYAYSFGTGFKYRLSKYYILLFGDYLNSPLKISNASGWDWNDEPYITEFKQDINCIAVTVGLGYFF